MSPVRGRPQARLAFLPRGRSTQMAKARDRQRGDEPQAPGSDAVSCNAPSPGSAGHSSFGVGWDDRSAGLGPLLGPGSSVLVGLGGPIGMGLDSHMQAGCLPTQVPSSQRPRPWADSGPPGTAHPAPLTPTLCRCHSTAHGQPATVRHAALPLRLGGQPSHASGPSVLGPGAVGPRPRQPSPQLGKAATHRHVSGTHTCFSPALSQRPDRDTTPGHHPRHATRSWDLPSSPEHVRCMSTPISVCMRLCACMDILDCSSHRGLTHPLPPHLHILDMCPPPHPFCLSIPKWSRDKPRGDHGAPAPEEPSTPLSPPSGRN